MKLASSQSATSWIPIFSVFVLLVGMLLLLEEMFRADFNLLWGLSLLPFAAAYFFDAYKCYKDQGLWRIIGSAQFFIGAAIALTVLFAAVPALFGRKV